MTEAIQELNEIIKRDYSRSLRMRPTPKFDSDGNMLNAVLCNRYYRYDEKWIPEEEPPTLQFIDSSTNDLVRACTRGNLSVVSGMKKSRKSMFVSLIVSAALKGDSVDEKFQPNPKDKGVIMYFDTEQATGDIAKVNRRIVLKSDITKDVIDDRLYHYELKGLSEYQMVKSIEAFMSEQDEDISLVVIDGIADINPNFNDIDESKATVSKIQQLCKDYDCHILNVIHTSKTTGFTMGHLGSFLDNKCESHFNLKADGDLSSVEAAASRGKSFEPFFIYFDEDKRVPCVDHETKPIAKEARASKRVFFDLDDKEHFDILCAAFTDHHEYNTSEVLFNIKQELHKLGLANGNNKTKEAKQYYIKNNWLRLKGTPGSKSVRFIWFNENMKLNGINYGLSKAG